MSIYSGRKLIKLNFCYKTVIFTNASTVRLLVYFAKMTNIDKNHTNLREKAKKGHTKILQHFNMKWKQRDGSFAS